MSIDIEELTGLMKGSSVVGEAIRQQDQAVHPDFELADDGEEYMPVGIDGVLAASEKLLAINRGLAEPDERDSLQFQKVFRANNMISESVRMDAGKVGRTMMYQAAKRKNLKGMTPFAFDPYIERLLVGNPLTAPLEEINPMQLVESARRMTKMGPGGLGSSRAITEESQNVHPTHFGFISPLEGPECLVQLSDTKLFAKEGWVPIDKVTLDTELACNIDGHLEFHKPEKVICEHYSGSVYGVRHQGLSFLVTPNHRFYCRSNHSKALGFRTAEEIYGKMYKLPCAHKPYVGKNADKTTYTVGDQTYDIRDWCALLGWFLSEGSLMYWKGKCSAVRITQIEDAHPEEFAEIEDLLTRMGIPHSYDKPSAQDPQGYTKRKGFRFGKITALCEWFGQYKYGCYDKWIPEEVFEWSIPARQALLDALLKGDGRVNKHHTTYCTVSRRLADSVERLMIGLGYCVRRRIERDKRPHVKTINYAVCQLKTINRDTETADKRYAPYWYTEHYEGDVYCVKVPGSMFYFSCEGRPGCWSGNSERAGIDVRAAWGTKLGSNGRLYQKFYDKRRKKFRWMSPEDLDGLTLKLPD